MCSLGCLPSCGSRIRLRKINSPCRSLTSALPRCIPHRGRSDVLPTFCEFESLTPTSNSQKHLFHVALTCRSKVRFAPFFFCKKNIRPLPCSSFFAESYVWRTCLLASALATARCRYQLFESSRVQLPQPNCLKYLIYVALILGFVQTKPSIVYLYVMLILNMAQQKLGHSLLYKFSILCEDGWGRAKVSLPSF